MRIRSIKPDFWRDRETTGRWPIDMKLVYAGLWCVADDDGRFEWELALLRADLDPFGTIPDLPGVMTRISETGCLISYESDGKRYGFLPNFHKHQKPNKPTPSKLPEPPRTLPKRSRRATVALPPGEEGRGEEGSNSGTAEEAPPVPPAYQKPPSTASVVALMPCRGKGNPQFPVTEAMVAEWQTTFPLVAVRDEVMKAVQWARDNEDRRKTLRGARRFFFNWLSNAKPRKVDPYAASIESALREAEDYAEGRIGLNDAGGSGRRCDVGGEAVEEDSPPIPPDGNSLQTTLGALLGYRGKTGKLQDATALELGAQLGADPKAGAVLLPGAEPRRNVTPSDSEVLRT